jgi:hypothetical protein
MLKENLQKATELSSRRKRLVFELEPDARVVVHARWNPPETELLARDGRADRCRAGRYQTLIRSEQERALVANTG